MSRGMMALAKTDSSHNPIQCVVVLWKPIVMESYVGETTSLRRSSTRELPTHGFSEKIRNSTRGMHFLSMPWNNTIQNMDDRQRLARPLEQILMEHSLDRWRWILMAWHETLSLFEMDVSEEPVPALPLWQFHELSLLQGSEY